MWRWHPREVDALTIPEYEAFCTVVDQRAAEAEAERRGGHRG